MSKGKYSPSLTLKQVERGYGSLPLDVCLAIVCREEI